MKEEFYWRANHFASVALALKLYTTEYDGSFPPSGWNKQHNTPRWIDCLHDWAVNPRNKHKYDEYKWDGAMDGVDYLQQSKKKFVINPNVLGHNIDDCSYLLARTIMIWERHSDADGNRWVGYVDGHNAIRHQPHGFNCNSLKLYKK